MYNSVKLIGFAGSEPNTRLLDSGSKVANFSLATSDKFKDKTGEKREKTTWHKITAFNAPAEIAEKYVKKGSKLFIEGRLNSRRFKDKNGVEKEIVEVIAMLVLLLDSKKDSEQDSKTARQQDNQQDQEPDSQPDQEGNDDLPW